MLHVNRTETTVMNLGTSLQSHSVAWAMAENCNAVSVHFLDQSKLFKTGDVQEHLEIRFHTKEALEGAIKTLIGARDGFFPEAKPKIKRK